MRDPDALISTGQLAAALGQPALRIYDCTTYLEPPPAGSDEPYVAVPGGHSKRHDFSGARLVAESLADLRLYALLGLPRQ